MAVAEDKAAFLREQLERRGGEICAFAREQEDEQVGDFVTYKVPKRLPIVAAGERVGNGQYRVDIRDGRSPFFVYDPKATAERWNNLPDKRRTIVIDLNHDSLYAGFFGGEGKAYGRIVSYEADEDGSIWGIPHWTEEGADRMRKGEFLFTSPVVNFSLDEVNGIQRRVLESVESVALTNNPATYSDLASFSRRDGKDEQQVDLSKMIAALGLPATATEQDVLAALAAGKEALSRAPTPAPNAAADDLAAERAKFEQEKAAFSKAREEEKLAAERRAFQAEQVAFALSKRPDLTPALREKFTAMGERHGIEVLNEALSAIPVTNMAAEIAAGKPTPAKEVFSADDAKYCRLSGTTKESFLAAREQLFGGDA